ncbi:MAG: glycosyltransferase family 39 protein [Deltaproteobacteria bacterium]|nr:glycosyltransferase family 39 protein [Deltaproteobacteria bacterium]
MPHSPDTDAVNHRRALLFISASFAIDILLIAVTRLGLSADEAHYWDWSRQLDLAYYSKGPMVAYVIRLPTAICGDTAFAVRRPAAILQSIFLVLFYRFAASLSGSEIAFKAMVLFRSTLMVSACGVAMTTDPLIAVFWMVALSGGYAAVIRQESRGWWVFGIATGFAFLSKYTAAILLPSMALFLVVSGGSRAQWRRFGLSCGVVGLASIPVIWWNAQHGWVNVAHNLGHVGASRSSLRIRPEKFLELVGGQLGLIGPLLCAALLVLTFRVLTRRRESAPRELFLASFVAPLLLMCVVVSFTKSVYANWPFPAFIGAMLLLVVKWNESAPVWRQADTLYRRSLFFHLPILAIAYLLYLGVTFWVPPQFLPTKKLVGGPELGARVEELLRSANKELFVITENYDTAALIAFYAPSHPYAMVDVIDGRRMNQYDVWGGWEYLVGRDALIVVKDFASVGKIRDRFDSIEPYAGAGENSLAIQYGGETLRTFHFFRARNFSGEPPQVPTSR